MTETDQRARQPMTSLLGGGWEFEVHGTDGQIAIHSAGQGLSPAPSIPRNPSIPGIAIVSTPGSRTAAQRDDLCEDLSRGDAAGAPAARARRATVCVHVFITL